MLVIKVSVELKVYFHMLDPRTKLTTGTFGGRKNWDTTPLKGTHAYNERTGLYAFWHGNSFKTGMELNQDCVNDLINNNNVL